MSGSAVDDAEGGTCRYTYTNGAEQDCYAIWAFPDIPSGTYDIYIGSAQANNPPKPVAPAAIKYNIYPQGGSYKIKSNPVDQSYDQGGWKLIKANQSITANSNGQYPVRITLGDAWFQSMQYVLLLDAVKVCVSE